MVARPGTSEKPMIAKRTISIISSRRLRGAARIRRGRMIPRRCTP